MKLIPRPDRAQIQRKGIIDQACVEASFHDLLYGRFIISDPMDRQPEPEDYREQFTAAYYFIMEMNLTPTTATELHLARGLMAEQRKRQEQEKKHHDEVLSLKRLLSEEMKKHP